MEINKNLAIIGASYLQLPLIEKAKEMGYTTHVFAWAANDVGEEAADYFYPISIVEKELGIKLDELGLHYSRFITHLKFFAQRMFAGELLDNQDQEFLNMIINKYPKEYDISEKISQFVQSKYGYDIPKEEKVYLAVYIKRIQPHIEI